MVDDAGLRPDVRDWFTRRTWQPVPWTAGELTGLKAGRTVSVVLPALNEEETVAGVVAAVRAAGPLVDEIVVMDGGCTDRTAERAVRAGARVVALDQVLPGLEPLPGKGEVLWRSLAATTGDLIAFVDADLVEVGPEVVVGLLGPLLTEPGVQLVKGFYRRPLRLGNTEQRSGGGRVTELVARPLLARFEPRLSGVVQPLGGEYAARRELLTRLPFAGGYGVEIALLMDTLRLAGLDAVGQVDLGVRKHRNRDLADLGVMASEILAVVLDRAGVDAGPLPVDLVQFAEGASGGEPGTTDGSGWHPVARHVARAGRGPVETFLTSS
ncbi:glucosyl-3-phosphoglycerate synthase [Kineosporia sp. J2-2]|uniref:Glucosyl-3-phosphoglycerate synthase n=1 Tax=Kineosporia corallincola TaxID=2835133 RepID=A0ABS5TJ36_9ACTN|nr:glucosyl-3-phosphoglycerate synthase [Kineosporia corallincola]MBT0770414.1 glucosyl-3-phosphoglycerate synthase [Kineosporia corallincola]